MRINPNALSPNIVKLLSANANGNLSAQTAGKAGKVRSPDSAALSPKSQSLGQIGALLGRLSAAVRNIDVTPDGLRAARADIRGIEQTIETALSDRNGSGSGFEVDWVSGAVNRYTMTRLDLDPGEELDLHVRVTQSAQQGGMYLSLGGAQLDLGGSANVTSTFTIRVSSLYGSRLLTFSSGQTITQMAHAINAYGTQLGIEATTTTSTGFGGIMLRTAGYGAAEFVSLQVIDDGSIGTARNLGIYRFAADNANAVDPTSHVDYNSSAAGNGYERVGKDVRGFINNVPASGYGTRLYAAMPAYAVSIDLKTGDLATNEHGNADHLGQFLAMRFVGLERDQDNAGGSGSDSGWWLPR